jgi:hypothetical protein
MPFVSSLSGIVQSHASPSIKTVVTRYRIHLEQAHYASTINLRLAAVQRLADEAADAGLLSPDLAAGIRRVKEPRSMV